MAFCTLFSAAFSAPLLTGHNTVVAGPSGTIATKSGIGAYGLGVGVQDTLVAGPAGTISTSNSVAAPVVSAHVPVVAAAVPLIHQNVLVPVDHGLVGQYVSGYGEHLYSGGSYYY